MTNVRFHSRRVLVPGSESSPSTLEASRLLPTLADRCSWDCSSARLYLRLCFSANIFDMEGGAQGRRGRATQESGLAELAPPSNRSQAMASGKSCLCKDLLLRYRAGIPAHRRSRCRARKDWLQNLSFPGPGFHTANRFVPHSSSRPPWLFACFFRSGAFSRKRPCLSQPRNLSEEFRSIASVPSYANGSFGPTG
jgi:hypothetical protein